MSKSKRKRDPQPAYQAQIGWSTYDIRSVRPDWDDERCVKFLTDNEDDIQCAMVERGWEVIRDLIRWEEANVSDV